MCEKKICQNTPVINYSLLLYSNWCHICILPSPAPTWFSLNYEKKSKILLVRNWRKIHQYHHTWLQTSVMFPNYVMIKTGVYYGVSIFGMARYRKRNLKWPEVIRFIQILGLFPFLWSCPHGIHLFTLNLSNWDGDDFAHLFLLLLRIHYYYYSVDLIW